MLLSGGALITVLSRVCRLPTQADVIQHTVSQYIGKGGFTHSAKTAKV